MMSKDYRSYNELAWTEQIVSSPKECREITEFFCKLIKNNSKIKPKTLLHFGCGAGFYDYTFKKHFQIAGVDASNEMLKIAKKLNPKVKYIHGDMRKARLDSCFDVVTIPDSIDYMTTIEDLNKAISNSCRHLKNDGILLIVAQMSNNFRENNFIYTGRKKDINVTVFENNTLIHKTGYEATLVYLIRQKKNLKVYLDKQRLGLFSLTTWNKVLRKNGLSIKKINLNNMYDRFMIEGGHYPQVIFVCRKRRIHIDV